VCGADWVELAAARRLPAEELLKFCFSAAFIVAALHDAMGIGGEGAECRVCWVCGA
jgi:hypothetical protein